MLQSPLLPSAPSTAVYESKKLNRIAKRKGDLDSLNLEHCSIGRDKNI